MSYYTDNLQGLQGGLFKKLKKAVTTKYRPFKAKGSASKAVNATNKTVKTIAGFGELGANGEQAATIANNISSVVSSLAQGTSAVLNTVKQAKNGASTNTGTTIVMPAAADAGTSQGYKTTVDRNGNITTKATMSDGVKYALIGGGVLVAGLIVWKLLKK